MPPHDPSGRLEALVAQAVDARARPQPSLDPILLAQIKTLCRQSDSAVLAAWECLSGHLKAPSSQSRLLALLLCEQLFQRSRAFRHALLPRLSQVLEATVGHRADRPLPPPAHAAASLREKALELLEGWERQWGAKYKQLPMAVRYLRDTLQLQFPNIATRAAAAAAERASREERQRAALRQRLGALLSGEWREAAAAARELLAEMQECFAILEEQQHAAAAQPAVPAAAQPGAAAADDLQWEDVQAEDAGPAAAGMAAPAEGLAAYAAEPTAAEEAAAEAAAAASSADLDVVMETLAGLHRQLANRTLPQLQDCLMVLGRAEPEGPAQEAAQQRTLRSATELRGRLAAAKQRCDAMALDLQALLLRRQRRERAAADGQQGRQGGEQAGAAGAAGPTLEELFGSSSSDSDAEDAQRPQQRQGQQRAQRGQLQPPQRGQRRRPAAAAADDDFESPYARIVDPTVARPLPSQPTQQQQQAAGKRAQAPQRSSSLPEELRRKLAREAPVLPTGPHTMFWDSKSVPTYVSGHGLEVSNHWGRVDVHQELPQERLDELFLLPMPASRQQGGNGASTAAVRKGKAPAQEQQQQQRQVEAAVPQLPPWPSQAGGSSAGAGPSSAAALAGGASAGDGRAAKRARRAEERAYNEAVIGGALSDELMARQLQDAEQQQQDPQQGGGGGCRKRTPKKISVKDRLAQKLLRGSVVAAAVRDSVSAENEMRRDKFSNRW